MFKLMSHSELLCDFNNKRYAIFRSSIEGRLYIKMLMSTLLFHEIFINKGVYIITFIPPKIPYQPHFDLYVYFILP